MKRFLKTFVLLIVSLFVLLSGVDAALDQLSQSGTQNSLIVYTDNGTAILAYNGDLNTCRALGKASASTLTFRFLHRT